MKWHYFNDILITWLHFHFRICFIISFSVVLYSHEPASHETSCSYLRILSIISILWLLLSMSLVLSCFFCYNEIMKVYKTMQVYQQKKPEIQHSIVINKKI